jgi:predicted transcriptional regulator
MDKWLITVRQLKAARALLDWTAIDLAKAATVPPTTMFRIESFEGPLRGRIATVEKVIDALERAGIVFIGDRGGGPGVCLPKPESGHESIPRI